MIISTKYLITGDGKTVLTDKAVYIGEDGKIGKIAPKEELLKEFPQEEVKEYGDATLLPGYACASCIRLFPAGQL